MVKSDILCAKEDKKRVKNAEISRNLGSQAKGLAD